MPNTKPVGVAFSDPELVAGTTITGATISGGTVSATDITTTGGLYIKSATVAAAGSTQANAAAVSDGFTLVSGADGTKGVVLPAAIAGRTVILKNNVAAVLKVWPASGDGINAITVDSNFTITNLSACMLVAYDSTTWYSIPLVAS
jgi:hypothetical protein